jgi:hypothetical protein
MANFLFKAIGGRLLSFGLILCVNMEGNKGDFHAARRFVFPFGYDF